MKKTIRQMSFIGSNALGIITQYKNGYDYFNFNDMGFYFNDRLEVDTTRYEVEKIMIDNKHYIYVDKITCKDIKVNGLYQTFEELLKDIKGEYNGI